MLNVISKQTVYFVMGCVGEGVTQDVEVWKGENNAYILST